MKVGIDARFITRQPRRGIGNYSLNLVNELVRLKPNIHFVLYIYKPDVEGLLPVFPNVTIRRLVIPFYPLWEQVALPIAAALDRVDILHCLGNTSPLFIPNKIRLVLSLMDVMFLQGGEYIPPATTAYQALGRAYRSFFVPHCARLAQQVITISEYSRRDVISLIPRLNPERVSISYLACDSAYGQSIESRKIIPDCLVPDHPYILALGAEDPRKNTLRLVKSYIKLLQSWRVSEDLVVCGYVNWRNSEAYRVAQSAGLSNRVRFFSFVSIEKLAMLYKSATLFVYPSLYEGFGIPILEAFSSGCPVAASNVTSIPEVAGDAAIYFDPLSEYALTRAMLRLIQDDNLRRAMVSRGYARIRNFSWENTARQTILAYQSCVSTGSKI
jgi:glycosyltransferase involved in cell wall biosynthesis